MTRHGLALGAAALVAAWGCGAPSSPPAALPTSPTAASPTVTWTPASPTPTAGPTRTPTPKPTPKPTSTTRPPTPHGSPAVVLWRGPTTRRVLALTFDAGSDVGHTQQVLDLLSSRHVVATFGLTGVWARANPALAHRIVSDGHQVVNHTDRHLSFTGRSTGTAPLTRAQRLQALAAAETSIRDATGAAALPWWRPPYGDRDASVDLDAGLAGYRHELMWTVDTLGWKGVPAAQVTSRVLDAAGPGVIVLMHVGSDSTDWQALGGLIDRLRAQGYGFVRADQL